MHKRAHHKNDQKNNTQLTWAVSQRPTHLSSDRILAPWNARRRRIAECTPCSPHRHKRGDRRGLRPRISLERKTIRPSAVRRKTRTVRARKKIVKKTWPPTDDVRPFTRGDTREAQKKRLTRTDNEKRAQYGSDGKSGPRERIHVVR